MSDRETAVVYKLVIMNKISKDRCDENLNFVKDRPDDRFSGLLGYRLSNFSVINTLLLLDDLMIM